MAFNGNAGLDARAGRTPCGEECQVTVADIAADQMAAGPAACVRFIIFVSIEIDAFATGPVMEPGASGSCLRGLSTFGQPGNPGQFARLLPMKNPARLAGLWCVQELSQFPDWANIHPEMAFA